jgi:hypothetical protein
MEIFGLNISLGKAKEKPAPTEQKDFHGFRAVNTEGLDLSKPFVDDYNSRSLRFVEFGESNLYPQILNQLYVSSPMHQACCNFKKYALCGDGYEWVGYEELTMPEKIQIEQFEIMSGLKKGLDKITLDWIKHGRIIALVRFDKENNKYTHFRIVDPEYIRNSRTDWMSDLPALYYYSRDWAVRQIGIQFSHVAPKNWDEWQVMELKNEVGGFRSYGMPDWAASANWQVVSADLGLLHKSAIENGIQPSIIWKIPYVMSPDERSAWEVNARHSGKGAKNYGRAIKLEAPSKDQLPEIDVVNTTDNHALFEQTSKEQKEEIAISHGINPALMGVRIAGSLGQSEEIEFSAKQFKRIWLNSNRKRVEDFLNELAKTCGIKTRLNIKETELIDLAMEQGEQQTQVVNGEPVAVDKEAEARAMLKGSVGGVQGIIQIQTAVAEGLTDRGSAIALLELIYGFSNEDATRLLGDVQEGTAAPMPTVNGQPTTQMEQITNDALRGLTAKENMDMMRIIRDYAKGKLAEPLARTRLAAYGIDSDTITEILST